MDFKFSWYRGERDSQDLKRDGEKLMIRPRMNTLLHDAIKKPLAIVCAQAGYGKTRAVYDFSRESTLACAWIQVSERDNLSSRFWESLVRAITQLDQSAADKLSDLGFPDTEEKMSRYLDIRERALNTQSDKRPLMIIDDFHLIENPDILAFLERFIHHTLEDRSLILITRESPRLNLADLRARDLVSELQEDELKFTDFELASYLHEQDIAVEPDVLREISRDTGGWALAIDLVARCLKRAPGYRGYAQSAMRRSVSELMEAEAFDPASEPLKRFLVSLSLIEHLSEDLVRLLARGDEILLAEFAQQSAYLRHDQHLNAWLIHPLFLDFLRSRQDMLTGLERQETYEMAGAWCEEHGYLTDALSYFEAAGDYDAIVDVLADLPFCLPYDLARQILEIFERCPQDALLHTDFLAVMHLRTLLSLGREQECTELAADFEQKFKQLPDEDPRKQRNLGLIYSYQGMMRHLMSTADGVYDFGPYFDQMHECLKDTPLPQQRWLSMSLGPWASLPGSGDPEALAAYTEASTRMIAQIDACIEGVAAGLEDLCRGETAFYLGDLRKAELKILRGLSDARKTGQFETQHRALLYLMRIAFAQGKRDRTEQAHKDLHTLLDEKDYAQRFMTCDIAQGWYAWQLRQPDLVPGWLREGFAPYGHAFFPENFGNQMKARYHYLTRDFAPLLAYIDEALQRESILFGRVELLAMAACARYQMKDRAGALATLRDAWELVERNGILTPFTELGRDMRTLSAYAQRADSCDIPAPWLEAVNRRSALYARYQATMIAEYEKEQGRSDLAALSRREAEVLHDLYAGFSRTDIATKQRLALSTVNMHVKGLYAKLQASNTADVIRIAMEQGLL